MRYLLLLILLGCSSRSAPKKVAAEVRWLKGQTHVHSANSGDSQTPPADVVRWYAARGYDFIVMTDHEHVTTEPGTSSMLVLPGVELTQNLRECEPPPPEGFGCLLHVNALFADRAAYEWPAPRGATRLELFTRALRVSDGLGAVAQLNHPNFHFAVDSELVAELGKRGLALMEIANMSEDSMNEGDADHVDTERLWDQVLDRGVLVFGTATDDAHHYEDAADVRSAGGLAFTGDKGWIMVRAAKDAASIEQAVAGGDFYATTGVLLTKVERGPDVYRVEVDPAVKDPVIRFIGPGSRVLAEHRAHAASIPVDAAWVRALITDGAGREAWTQPTLTSR